MSLKGREKYDNCCRASEKPVLINSRQTDREREAGARQASGQRRRSGYKSSLMAEGRNETERGKGRQAA